VGDIKQPRIKSPSKYRVERLLLCARSENRRLRALLCDIVDLCKDKKMTLKICDIREENIMVGMRVRSSRLGTIIRIDKKDDNYAWIRWDGDSEIYSGFYGNDCACEIDGLVQLKQSHEMRSNGLCMNGCNKPIAQPSKVVCQDCLDAMGKELAAMLARMEGNEDDDEDDWMPQNSPGWGSCDD